MKIITVIPLGRGIKKELTYFSKNDPGLGTLVVVPVRQKFVEAVVIDVKDLREHKSAIRISDFGLKKIQEVKDWPVWSPEFFEATRRAARFFARSLGEIIATFLPKAFLETPEKLAAPRAEAEKSGFRAEKLVFQASLNERLDFYKTFIRESFARKKSLIFILPRLADIDFFAKRLSRGLEKYTFSIHGKLTAKKQVDIANKIITEEHPVLILATGQFLSLPRHDLDAIIVERESSEEFETATTALDTRNFAEIFAETKNLKIIFADTLLRLETIWRTEKRELSELMPLNFRLIKQPKIVHQEKWAILELPTFKMIQKNQAGRTFLFALRKGLATTTVCRDCETTVLCEKCERPLVLTGEQERIFTCHNCRKIRSASEKCSNCKSWNLVPLGTGDERVYEEIKKDFPGRNVFLFKKPKDIEEFLETPGAILIGGENALALLKEEVENAAVISLDTLWNIPDFRMNEKALKIIIDLLEKTKGEVIIQTRRELELKENLLDFVREELALREKYNYPPFTRLVEITLPQGSRSKQIAKEFEGWAPEEWQHGRKMTLIIKIPKEKWNFEEVNPTLCKILRRLPPGVEVLIQ